MRHDSFYLKPYARVSFTDDEIALMTRLAAAHYDGACRQAGRPGGTLYGIRATHEAHREVTGSAPTFDLTFSDLDLLAKIAETNYPCYGSTSTPTTTQAALLRDALVKTMMAVDKKAKEANP